MDPCPFWKSGDKKIWFFAIFLDFQLLAFALIFWRLGDKKIGDFAIFLDFRHFAGMKKSRFCGFPEFSSSVFGDEKIEILRDFRRFVVDEKIEMLRFS